MRSVPTRKAGGFASVAVGVAALTLTSRILGFGRSVVFSKTVGDTCLGDAYNAANLLPNVLFEIVAGGVLAGVVIPVVARHVAAARTAEATRTTSALVTWTLLVLTPTGLVAFLGAHLYAAAFNAGSCPGGAPTLAALLVMFVPQVWLYGLAVVSAGVLQAHGRFLAAAAGPLLSSVVVICAYLAYARLEPTGAAADLARLPTDALRALGWGTTLGVAALALTTLVPLGRLGLQLRPRLRFAAGDTRVIIRIAGAGLAGLVMQQLSLLVISWAAKHTGDPGALTRFSWANAVYLLPFAVLVAPLLQLVFPRLSAAAADGPDAVREVLSGVVPAVVVLSGLGAALLVATAVPVARVFVLGPGSGRTAALAWPIAAFAPAAVGFALLGLASRALLAQHLARSAGLATVVGWAVVFAGALILRLVVPTPWVVPSLSAAVSVGMIAGAVTGWTLLDRSLPPPLSGPGTVGLWRPLAVCLPVGLVAGLAVGWLSTGLLDVGLVAAGLGAVGCAVACTVLFVGLLLLLDRQLLRQVWALRSRTTAPAGSGPAAGPGGAG
jgi:putative peptidoglycan lipid II flippase